MLSKVREEMGLRPPASGGGDGGGGGGSGGDGDGGGGGERSGAAGKLRTDELVGIHIRRGDKRDLGAKERGEPFSDEQYITAALALADEVGACGFIFSASSSYSLLPTSYSIFPT